MGLNIDLMVPLITVQFSFTATCAKKEVQVIHVQLDIRNSVTFMFAVVFELCVAYQLKSTKTRKKNKTKIHTQYNTLSLQFNLNRYHVNAKHTIQLVRYFLYIRYFLLYFYFSVLYPMNSIRFRIQQMMKYNMLPLNRELMLKEKREMKNSKIIYIFDFPSCSVSVYARKDRRKNINGVVYTYFHVHISIGGCFSFFQ